MTSTLPRRLVAGAAVAVTGVGSLTLATTAYAAGHGHHRHHGHHAGIRLNTNLKIHVARRTAANGAADTVYGHLASRGHRLVNEPVILQDRAVGSHSAWAQAAEAKTGRRGMVYFPVTPTAPTRYRLVFRGTPNFQPSHSHPSRVVRVRNTSLTLSASPTSVDPGTSVTLNGALTANGAPAANEPIQLRDKQAGSHARHFTTVATSTTDANGDVTFTQTPTATTRYVLVFAKTDTLNAARSRVVTVAVKAPSSLSIRERAGHQAGHVVISGDLRGGGHNLVHRKVTLLERPSGSTAAWTTVATHRTDKRGYVQFRQQPTTSTDYELGFAGGRFYDGCQSGVVTVTVS